MKNWNKIFFMCRMKMVESAFWSWSMNSSDALWMKFIGHFFAKIFSIDCGHLLLTGGHFRGVLKKCGYFPRYFWMKLKKCLSRAIKYYWDVGWCSNCNCCIPLGLRNAKNNYNMIYKYVERDVESKTLPQ